MKKIGSHNYRSSICYILLSSFILFASCGKIDNPNMPLKTGQGKNPAKAIEFGMNERLVKNNIYLDGENVGNLKESEIFAKIKNYAAGIDKSAIDATLDSNTWQVTKGKEGRKVNIEKTMNIIMSSNEGSRVDLVTEIELPSITSKVLLDNISIIGDYTTPLLDRKTSRINNIDLAAQKIDYFKLTPGEEFSFNNVVGRRTAAKGYEDAPIIIKTKDGPKKSKAVGGGICQVSTTLYNAIEECGMEMLERHLHSKDVGYVPKGEDATVNYGSADFRFKNIRKYPIMIRTYLERNKLTIKVLENRNP